jgi:hypothetical protein
MSWERGKYYTRSQRARGRIVREYIGSGIEAELQALIDANERRAREVEQARRREQRAADEASEADIDEFCLLVEAVAHAELQAAGFHHHKGSWRKKRGHE